MTGPLSGVRVLNFGIMAAGPWACTLLGEMGAEVIKLEPLRGDPLSHTASPHKNGISAIYIPCNLNQLMVQVDLDDDSTRATLVELVRASDILIENHRPGFLARRGLSYEDAAKINPRLIYCSSSGYGSRGPYAEIGMGSGDPNGQAISGFASVSGPVGGIPERMKGTDPASHVTAQYIVSGVLAALCCREVTGRGQFVDTSQMHATVSLAGARAAEYFASGVPPVPMGSGVGSVVPSRAFRGSDGQYFNVSAVDETTWRRLCTVLGLSSITADPRLRSNAGRVAHRDVVDGALDAVLSMRPAEEWISLLIRAGVPAGGYATFNNLRINPQVLEHKMIEDVETPWGRVTVGGMPWHFSRTPGGIRGTHLPGADTEEVLERFAPRNSGGELAPPPASPLPTMRGPLAHLRVVDITQGYVGFCGMTLADLGATVVKVEPPGGDYLRAQGPPFVGRDAAAFLGVNRSKRSVQLAWETDPASRGAFDRLVAESDVLISDFQSAAAKERGVDYDALKAACPRLVLCSITPFGDSGPMSDQPATDLEVQGISGQWQFLGEPGGEPIRVGVPIGPLFAAIFGVHGILAAVYERGRSGTGQRVSVSQLGAQLAMQSNAWACESEPDDWNGHALLRVSAPARGYQTADRAVVWSFGRDEAALTAFLERLGVRQSSLEAVVAPSDSTIRAAFLEHTAEELCGWIRALKGTAAPYHTFESLQRDPQAHAVGLVSEYDYPGYGRIGTTGLAWEFSVTPATHGRPPLLNEHAGAILGESGYVVGHGEPNGHDAAE